MSKKSQISGSFRSC